MRLDFAALAVAAAVLGAACGSRTGVLLDSPIDATAPEREVPEAASCGPTNCQGCCDDAGACLTGDAQTACGEQGRACVVCVLEQNDICHPQPDQPDERFCFAPCDPRYCLGGCCVFDGTCIRTMSDTTCGADGLLCKNCAATGQVCHASGTQEECVGQ